MSAATQAALHEAIIAHCADEDYTFEALTGVQVRLVTQGLRYRGIPQAVNRRVTYRNGASSDDLLLLAAPDAGTGAAEPPQLRQYPFGGGSR